MQNNKGFTFIESMVIIIIVCFLSGLIIVSMNNSQNSAKDSRIKAAMDQMRFIADSYKTAVGGGISYGAAITSGTCTTAVNSFTTSTGGALLCTDINTQGGAAVVVNISTDGTSYCMSKKLNRGSLYNCVDSAGKIGKAACGAAIACP